MNQMMTREAMIALAMRKRAAQGLHVRITGLDMPSEGFDAYARDEAERDRWVFSYRAKGYDVEVVEA